MAGSISTIRFGRVGYELTLTAAAGAHVSYPWTFDVTNLEAENKNTGGEVFTRVHKRLDLSWTVNLMGASDLMRDAVTSLSMIGDAHLSLLFADQWFVNEQYTSDTTTGFALASNPYILLDAAYNAITGTATLSGFTVSSSYAGLGDLTGGITVSSYDRATGRLVISPTTVTAATLYVNYRTQGALVKFSRRPRIKQSNKMQSGGGGRPGWDIAFTLKGV